MAKPHRLIGIRFCIKNGGTDVENQLLLVGESIGNGNSFGFVDTATIKKIDQKWIMEILGKDAIGYMAAQFIGAFIGSAIFAGGVALS